MATVVDGAHLEEAGSAAAGIAGAESIAAIVTVVLAILGLGLVSPALLVAIATIALGIALIVQGVSVATSFGGLLTRSATSSGVEYPGGSLWAGEFLAGGAGIVLGILALLQLRPQELVAIASIGYGGALIIGGGAIAELSMVRASAGLDGPAQRVIRSFASSSASALAMSALASIVLGILALAGFAPTVLILIALLQLGAFLLLSGSALGTLLMSVLTGRY